MSRHVTFALLAGASFLSIAIDSAAAFDGAAPEPRVIYANDPQATAVRAAYAGRGNMGGGFIQFLFGDGPQSQRRSGRCILTEAPTSLRKETSSLKAEATASSIPPPRSALAYRR